MNHTGRTPLTRLALGAVVLAGCGTLLPTAAIASQADGHHARASASAGTSSAAPTRTHGKTRIRGFDDDRTTIVLGRKASDRVVVLPHERRTILVQARRDGAARFTTQSRGHTTAQGTFRAAYAPTSAGAWRFRLVVLPTPTRASATSSTRVIRAVDVAAPRPVTELRVSGISLDSATLSWVNPAARDFTGVTIRRATGPIAPVSQVAGTAVANTGPHGTTFAVHGLSAGTEYSFALFAHDASGNFSRATTVTLRTGRFGVSSLQAGSVSRTAVTLDWVNPTDTDFSGVIVRRADGTTPPASATDGTAVGDDLSSPTDSVTDSGLTAGTTYSYAVFAHDGAQHVAAAVTATVTTRGNGLSPMLSVNPLPSVHTGERVTAGRSVAFDGSDSLPAVGAQVVSWEISYGDHITDSFNGAPSPVDVMNTTHTFTDAGMHTVTLTLTDSDGNTDSTTLAVNVLAAPTVSISTPSSTPEAGAVPFAIDAETPTGTAITSYRMEITGDDTFFLDGDSAPPTAQDLDLDSGSYTVVLSVTNDAGGTATSDPVQVEVP